MRPSPNDFRIVGQWLVSRCTFLIVMGVDAQQCKELLPLALDGYTYGDLCAVESMWYEYWNDVLREWVPLAEIPMRVVKRMVSRMAA